MKHSWPIPGLSNPAPHILSVPYNKKQSCDSSSTRTRVTLMAKGGREAQDGFRKSYCFPNKREGVTVFFFYFSGLPVIARAVADTARP